MPLIMFAGNAHTAKKQQANKRNNTTNQLVSHSTTTKMELFGNFSKIAGPPPFWEPLVQKKLGGFCGNSSLFLWVIWITKVLGIGKTPQCDPYHMMDELSQESVGQFL